MKHYPHSTTFASSSSLWTTTTTTTTARSIVLSYNLVIIVIVIVITNTQISSAASFTLVSRSSRSSRSICSSSNNSNAENKSSDIITQDQVRCDTAYGHACITHLKGAEEFMNFLQQEEDDEVPICVVRFSADWCKACKSLDVRYHKLAEYCQRTLPPEESIRFAEVMYKGNEILCDTLGIKSFPCIHIYKGCQGLLSNLTGCKAQKNSESVVYHNMITLLKDELNRLLEQRRLRQEQGIDDDSDADECMLMDIQDSPN